MKKMQYHIISGAVIETRRCYLPDSRTAVRGERKAGRTSLRKIKANEREEVRRLARILNCNWGEGMLFVTLNYKDAPESYDAAQANLEKFLRKARRLHEQQTGEKLRYLGITANWSIKKNRSARLHHHIVMDRISMDLIAQCWQLGQVDIERRGGTQDLTPLASYLFRQVVGLEKGKKHWSASKGLAKPIFTEPKEVQDIEGIEPIPGASVVDAMQTTDEEGVVVGSYIRAICTERIRVRGGMVILPKRKKNRRVPVDISELAALDE